MLRTSFFLILVVPSLLLARPSYRGYSGAPGTNGTCASSCHGQGNGTVEITGFPESYAPDSVYLITITAVSGSSISNFNGSVRVGTGSSNAGVISSGTNTSTYNVNGETNGIHLSANNRMSGTFNWQAPASGTGSVRLYVGAFQGTGMNSGRTTEIEMIATEAVNESPPGLATNPTPADGATDVDVLNATLSWSAADRADNYEVFLGIVEPTISLGSVSATQILVPDTLNYETEYVWRVDATNEFGTTTGTLWRFTTITELPPLPGPATNPIPAAFATNVPVTLSVLTWSEAEFAEDYEVFFGQTEPLEFYGTTPEPSIDLNVGLTYDTSYMWRVDPRNMSGSSVGMVWTFRTERSSAARGIPVPEQLFVGPAYPNPFNSTVRVSLTISQSAQVRARVFDINGRAVAVLVNGRLSVGEHVLEWDASGSSAGLYFLRSDFNGMSDTQKLIYLP